MLKYEEIEEEVFINKYIITNIIIILFIKFENRLKRKIRNVYLF